MASGKSLFSNHWYMARYTAILMVPLGIWVVYALSGLALEGGTREQFIEWANTPMNFWLLLGFIAVLAYHSFLHMVEVITDYIPGPKCQALMTNLLRLTLLGAVAVSAYAIVSLQSS